jgi:hypothetical protein
MILFKVLNEDGRPFYGGSGRWALPQNGKPGDWMPPIKGELEPCVNGYHLCCEQDLVHWLGPAIWVAEYRGEYIECDDKIVVRETRLLSRVDTWNERTARLFACDCAERVLHLCGDDERPRNAIAVARRYANGDAADDELEAAREAAWYAAGAAARAAARDAAGAAAWYAAGAAAWYAAGAAAGAAARAAAGDAAGDAAWDAEREWQTARLMEYLGYG